MMDTPIRHLSPLLPHAGDMILLDEICSYSDDRLQAVTRIGPDHLFLDENGQLPMWVSVEIMAQAIAALAGCHAHDAGEPVKLGFLLGSRHVDILRPSVAQGSLLRVDVTASTRDQASGFGVFDCVLSLLNDTCDDSQDEGQGEPLVNARLSVFSPPDLDHYLQEQTT
ncbi:thioester dehydrase [Advenella kashmirensis W13003]|uniref:Thioester dehydrase n=1 Tax=Advenella kashmirensis W13003 TaxID=1424334 RepID=V8QVC0_9BURK|nr:thioester dehydrase [Advenella kashmirensis]ETF03572.1 thioester dehydrase [Advenella kashmirensis W13003]